MNMFKPTNVKTPEKYLASLPPDRRKTLQKVREIIKKNLPAGFEEGMQYGMVSYFIPLSAYPNGYLNDKKTPLPYIALASQKHHMAIYHMGIYGSLDGEKWIKDEYEKAGKKLDMGKSCIRFKKLEDLPLDIIGQAAAIVNPDQYINLYEQSRKSRKLNGTNN